MTRKHFEELALSVAILYGQLSAFVSDSDVLLNTLIDNLADFCREQNSRFNYSRFKDRVLEHVNSQD